MIQASTISWCHKEVKYVCRPHPRTAAQILSYSWISLRWSCGWQQDETCSQLLIQVNRTVRASFGKDCDITGNWLQSVVNPVCSVLQWIIRYNNSLCLFYLHFYFLCWWITFVQVARGCWYESVLSWIIGIQTFRLAVTLDSAPSGLWKYQSHFCQMCVVQTAGDPRNTSMNFPLFPEKAQ